MNISKLIVSVLLFLPALCLSQQTVKIYHGVTGRTEILKGKKTIGRDEVIKDFKGKIITIQIQNPHPALYDYKFNVETIKEEEPKIEETEGLLKILAGKLGGSSARLSPNPGRWQDDYRDKIIELKDQLSKAYEIIKQSDAPETITDVVNNSSGSGFLYAKVELAKLAFFTDKDLDATVTALSASFKVPPYSYIPGDVTEKVMMESFDAYMQALTKLAKDIKAAYSGASSTITYKITVGDSVQLVTLSITSKSKDLKSRETGDKLISIRIEPFYDRPLLEFIPVATMSFAKNISKFGLENDLVVKTEDDSFKFLAGGVLNLNINSFGPRKEWSFGAGPGFAIADGDLNNFYLNFLISYKKWVRIGLGAGYLSSPSYLKDGATEGKPLPSNITDLNKVIGYEKKAALFFTFVFPGLNLPLL